MKKFRTVISVITMVIAGIVGFSLEQLWMRQWVELFYFR